MARGVNKVILVGNIGNQPETAYTPSGTAVTKFTLATAKTYKKDGAKVEDTAWHRLVSFGKVAEIIAQYAQKGSKTYIEGELKYGKYEKDGVTHYTTDIVVNEFLLLDSRNSGKSETQDNSSTPQGADFDDSEIPF